MKLDGKVEMDARVFRMAILTIVSAFILVLVIIYATNTDKINSLLGFDKIKETSTVETSIEESSEVVIYGDQIGDNLDGFLLDEDFFDETEDIPAGVVIRKSTGSEKDADSAGGQAASSDQEDNAGTGMAVVGQLENPDAQPPVDENGYLTSVPEAPPGGFGEYIPGGSVVGTP